MRAALSLIATVAVPAAALLVWRATHAAHVYAPLVFAVPALLSLLGAYAAARCRRQAFLGAALQTRSPLRRWLGGRIPAALSAVLATAVAMPGVAYLALAPGRGAFLFALAVVAIAALALAALQRAAGPHIRRRLLPVAIAPPAILLALSIAIPVHVWLSVAAFPLPAYLDAETLPGAVSAAIAGLEIRNPAALEILSFFRAVEATGYWLLARTDFAFTLPLIVFLAHNAVVFASLATLVVNTHTLVFLLLEAERRDGRN